jgi:predicted protein tyrosine phosphatase
MIHVCSLAALPETVRLTGASHVLTVMANVEQVARPVSVLPANHLKVSMDDITEEMDGFVAPSEAHIDQVLNFVRGWDRSAPLVVHCYAGISRSTASAFAAVCALNPTATSSRSPGRSVRPRRSPRRTGASSALPTVRWDAAAACCARSTRSARAR